MRSITTYVRSLPPRPTSRRLGLITVLIITGGGALCLLYTNVATHTGLAHIDQPALNWITAHRIPPLTMWMQFVTNLMSPPILTGTTFLLASIWIWRKKEYWRPGLLVLALSGSLAISSSIKDLVERARPPAMDMVLPLETGYSFPSNHTFGVAVCVLILGYLLYSRRRSTRLLFIWATVGITSIVLISLSRMYLGYHWFTDVVAAFCLAVIILGLVVLIDTFQSRTSRQ